jgi:porin
MIAASGVIPPALADDSGVTLRLQYSGEAFDNVSGGMRDGANYLNQVDVQLRVDAAKAFGIAGGHFLFEGFYENNVSPNNTYIGAVQDPSILDSGGTALFRLYQAYYTQDFGNTSVMAGIFDLEYQFGATAPMSLFFGGVYPGTSTLDESGLNGPSTYPAASLGLRLRQKLDEHWSVQAAVLDGVPDSQKDPAINTVNINKVNGALFIGEVAYTPEPRTQFLAGGWDYTGKFPALGQFGAYGDPRMVFGSRGGYFGAATRVYSASPRRGLDIFANIGLANAEVNQTASVFNGGLMYTGLFPGRPRDQLGASVSFANAGHAYKAEQAALGNPVSAYETNFEFTYRAPVTSWLVVQPDIQYWIHPGMNPLEKNDLLLMLHFEISHVFDF